MTSEQLSPTSAPDGPALLSARAVSKPSPCKAKVETKAFQNAPECIEEPSRMVLFFVKEAYKVAGEVL